MNFHLAQVNLAYALGAQDDPVMAGFIEQLDEINQLAEASAGFVWRYLSDTRDPAQREFADPLVLFNLTVWESMQALHAFTYRTNHAKVFAARRKWFADWKENATKVSELGEDVPAVALWWIPAGHIPAVAESIEKLRLLGRKGPTPAVFTFKQPFGADGHPLER